MATYVSLGVDINPSPATATVRTTATVEQQQQLTPGGEQQETPPPPLETPADRSSFNPLWLILAGVALGGIAISATRSTGLQGLGGSSSGCGCGG